MNTRKQVKLAALKKEAKHYCCNFIIDVQTKNKRTLVFIKRNGEWQERSIKRQKEKNSYGSKASFKQ